MTLSRSVHLLFIAVASTALAQQPPTIFPFEPAQLLGVLPTAPVDWKIARSEADSSLGEWLETRATRTFQPSSGLSNGLDSSPASTGEVEISVTDTAGFAASLAQFADFAPGKNAIVEKKFLGSLPAILTSGEGGHRLTQVLVSKRYLVEITITNLPQQHVEDWLRIFHFENLPQKPVSPTKRPLEFRLSHVDELHPENDRSYVVSTTSSKRVNEFLKSLPPESIDSGSNRQDTRDPLHP